MRSFGILMKGAILCQLSLHCNEHLLETSTINNFGSGEIRTCSSEERGDGVSNQRFRPLDHATL